MAIVLHQPKGPWGEPSMSPFCMKLECWLRMAGIAFETRAPDFRRLPKGKMPYVDIDGQLMGDSQLIIEHLSRTRGIGLDDHLTVEQKAVSRAVRRMIEEATYFVGVYARWGDDAGWPATRAGLAENLPPIARPFLPLMRRTALKTLHGQGTARHTPDEIYAMGIADYEAVSTMLGAKPFFFGERASSLDATLYGFLEAVLSHPNESPLKKFIASRENLVGFRNRMRATYFADHFARGAKAQERQGANAAPSST